MSLIQSPILTFSILFKVLQMLRLLKGYLLAILLIIVLASCTNKPKDQVAIETEFNNACSSCHLAPKPKNITKELWLKNVLPEMAARMGLAAKGYNHLSGNSMEENVYVKLSGIYPATATIDTAKWHRIQEYILNLAPEKIAVDSLRNLRNAPLTLFKPSPITLDKNGVSMITDVQFDSLVHNFSIADIRGSLKKWPPSGQAPLQFRSPVISDLQIGASRYITEIGYMNPSEKPLGVLHKITATQVDTLINKLHRPVFTTVADLNNNGEDEILICEFGHHTGELSLLKLQDGAYVKSTLLPLPGTIKLELADMNHDGRTDIIVLSSQGNEGISILYQQEDLQFLEEQVISMGPEYGSSWFELIDFNHDGALDIVLVNGDNADYSIFLKPYHGLRIFLNDGLNAFNESWFYPLYGATRVLTDDYDLDGDLDFAIMSFFAETGKSPDESFVYLENIDAQNFVFKPFAFEKPFNAKWLVMDKGDHDQDGDVDIILGAFVIPSRGMQKNQAGAGARLDLLLLENKTR